MYINCLKKPSLVIFFGTHYTILGYVKIFGHEVFAIQKRLLTSNQQRSGEYASHFGDSAEESGGTGIPRGHPRRFRWHLFFGTGDWVGGLHPRVGGLFCTMFLEIQTHGTNPDLRDIFP